MQDLLYKEETHKVLGLCMKIHSTPGMGLKEINYKDAMQIGFEENDIPYEREKKYIVKYKKQDTAESIQG